MFVSFTGYGTVFKTALGSEQGVDWDVVGIQEVGVMNDKEYMCLRQEGFGKEKMYKYKQEQWEHQKASLP